MNIRIDETFEKDLRKIKSKPLDKKVALLIRDLLAAESLTEIRNLKLLKGSDVHYRIRLGDYRVGLIVSGKTLILVRILHRKEIYRFFP
ncbi:type II toxin-antitoxin system RelE family toxin [Lacibacter sp. H407]|uniref:type II toxin-antitoxin system RelE family toxin n=1 Tax=Lacibacter sp. H407 TaxID=3133423 RepID=UPI0030BC333C